MPTAANSERYQVVRKLDAGGMAEVYQGILTAGHGVEKPVAIKRVLPHLAKNEKFIKMFIDEARLSMRMSHANIVQMFDIGVSNDTYFLVMEFVDGANLKTILDAVRAKGSSIPLEYAVWIMVEVCKGLDYAHSLTDRENKPLNIVHRDISPPNILISRRGEVKIVDFGLAKAGTQLEKTDPGVVKGKFSYLSPELAHGVEPDARSDIFAVGILLFELVTGKRLFYGDTDYATIQLVRQARVPRPSAINPKVAADLEAVILRALARDPAARYQNGMELGSDLAQYLFAHGLRVTAFDIAKMVQEVTAVASPKRSEPSLIDALIQEEIVRFTSIEASPQGGSPTPTAPDEGSRPLDAALFEDPRSWTLDTTHDGPPSVPPGTMRAPGPAPGELTATGRPRTIAPGQLMSTTGKHPKMMLSPPPAAAPPPPIEVDVGDGGLARALEGTGPGSDIRPATDTRAAVAAAIALRESSGARRVDPATGRQAAVAPARPGREPREDSGGSGGRVAIFTLIVLLVLAGGVVLAHVLGYITLPLPIPRLSLLGGFSWQVLATLRL